MDAPYRIPSFIQVCNKKTFASLLPIKLPPSQLSKPTNSLAGGGSIAVFSRICRANHEPGHGARRGTHLPVLHATVNRSFLIHRHPAGSQTPSCSPLCLPSRFRGEWPLILICWPVRIRGAIQTQCDNEDRDTKPHGLIAVYCRVTADTLRESQFSGNPSSAEGVKERCVESSPAV